MDFFTFILLLLALFILFRMEISSRSLAEARRKPRLRNRKNPKSIPVHYASVSPCVSLLKDAIMANNIKDIQEFATKDNLTQDHFALAAKYGHKEAFQALYDVIGEKKDLDFWLPSIIAAVQEGHLNIVKWFGTSLPDILKAAIAHNNAHLLNVAANRQKVVTAKNGLKIFGYLLSKVGRLTRPTQLSGLDSEVSKISDAIDYCCDHQINFIKQVSVYEFNVIEAILDYVEITKDEEIKKVVVRIFIENYLPLADNWKAQVLSWAGFNWPKASVWIMVISMHR